MAIRYFLGANSAAGFESRYDGILPRRAAGTLRVLKGGPGCGKSTLMKKVAAHAEQLGLAVEYIHCSSDPGSLDGILIPALSYAVVDGTAPHAVEPELCGCGERYVDLGGGADEAPLRACRPILFRLREDALKLRAEASSALAALAAADRLIPEGEALQSSLAERLIPEHGDGGAFRRIFLSGHTPEGRMTFWETAADLCPVRYALRGSPAQISAFLRAAEETAARRGCSRILCDSPLLPGQQAEQLLLPEAGIAFLSDTALSPCPLECRRVIGSHPDEGELLEIRRRLLRLAARRLRTAREYHSMMEEACRPYLCFAAANRAALDCCSELEALRPA